MLPINDICVLRARDAAPGRVLWPTRSHMRGSIFIRSDREESGELFCIRHQDGQLSMGYADFNGSSERFYAPPAPRVAVDPESLICGKDETIRPGTLMLSNAGGGIRFTLSRVGAGLDDESVFCFDGSRRAPDWQEEFGFTHWRLEVGEEGRPGHHVLFEVQLERT